MKLTEEINVIKKLAFILRPETSFYIISIIYGIGVSLLTLAIPISVQALVNTVTFGVLIQPLIILSIVLLALLTFSGVLNGLQSYVIELFQRHFYARVSADIALSFLQADHDDLLKKNGEELANRYFDVMTVQKSLSTLLIGGVSVVLQTFVGLLLLAFYHPYFLVFDILLLIMVWFVWAFFGSDAIYTSVKESKAKYAVANWLQEVARVNMFFKSRKRKECAIAKTDSLIQNYLNNRKAHFRKVFSQVITLLVIYAIMSAFILGLGGYLVTIGQLSLGQLVAAELVVTVILSSFSKSGKYLESFYDLYAATDKISALYDFKKEEVKIDSESEVESSTLELKHVIINSIRFQFDFNFKFEQGKIYHAIPQYHSAKIVFINLLQGITKAEKGIISLGGKAYDDFSTLDIRDLVYIVDGETNFEGSIRENLTVANPELSQGEIFKILDIVDLPHLNETFENGIDQQLLSNGHPLWPSQRIRMEIAKALILKPKVLVLTEIFDQVENHRREKIIEYLKETDTTVIIFSNKELKEVKFDKYLQFGRSEIKEFNSFSEAD